MLQNAKTKIKKHSKHWKGEIIFMVALLKHDKVPKIAKIAVFTLLSYIFSPLDLIPDFVPIFGHWDDLIMIPIVMKIVNKVTPNELILSIRTEISEREDVALFTGWGTKLAAFTVFVLWIIISIYTLKFAESFFGK